MATRAGGPTRATRVNRPQSEAPAPQPSAVKIFSSEELSQMRSPSVRAEELQNSRLQSFICLDHNQFLELLKQEEERDSATSAGLQPGRLSNGPNIVRGRGQSPTPGIGRGATRGESGRGSPPIRAGSVRGPSPSLQRPMSMAPLTPTSHSATPPRGRGSPAIPQSASCLQEQNTGSVPLPRASTDKLDTPPGVPRRGSQRGSRRGVSPSSFSQDAISRQPSTPVQGQQSRIQPPPTASEIPSTSGATAPILASAAAKSFSSISTNPLEELINTEREFTRDISEVVIQVSLSDRMSIPTSLFLTDYQDLPSPH